MSLETGYIFQNALKMAFLEILEFGIAIFKSMCPGSRDLRHAMAREEVRLNVETRTGMKVKDPP